MFYLLEFFLIKYYFFFILLLLVISGVTVFQAVKKNSDLFREISRATYLKLAGIILLSFILRSFFAPQIPQVFNDEFYYLGTAENIAKHQRSVPLIQRGYPPHMEDNRKFIPPYPQGWPVLVSLIFIIGRQFTFNAASGLTMFLSALLPVPIFFAGFLFFRKKEDNDPTVGEICGLWAASMWAAVPVVIKMSRCASPATGSAFFIALFVGAVFLYRIKPGHKTFLAMAACLGLAVNFRPENILYVLLPVAVLYDMRENVKKDAKITGTLLATFYALISLVILASAASDPDRMKHFVLSPRPAYSSLLGNVIANMVKNFLFFFGRNGVHPWFLTVLFAGGLYVLGKKEKDKPRTVLLSGWLLFFYLVLSIFPFGDLSGTESFDSYRYSMHLYFPLTLSAAYCCYSLWSLARKRWAFYQAVSVILACVIFMGAFFHTDFFRRPHPQKFYYYSVLKSLKDRLPDNSIMVGENIEDVLMTHYTSNIPTYLLKNKQDVMTFNPKDKNAYIFLTDPPSDLMLENFEMEIVSRHQKGSFFYSIVKIEKY